MAMGGKVSVEELDREHRSNTCSPESGLPFVLREVSRSMGSVLCKGELSYSTPTPWMTEDALVGEGTQHSINLAMESHCRNWSLLIGIGEIRDIDCKHRTTISVLSTTV